MFATAVVTVVWLVSLNINLLTLIFLDFAKFTVLRICNFVDSYILVNKHVWCNFLCHFPSINLLLVAHYFMYRYFNISVISNHSVSLTSEILELDIVAWYVIMHTSCVWSFFVYAYKLCANHRLQLGWFWTVNLTRG